MSGQLHARASFTPGERAPGSHWTGSWMGPRAGLGAVVKRKNIYARFEAFTVMEI